MISINRPAVKVNQIKAITGAVERYVVKYFIEFIFWCKSRLVIKLVY